ncbi:MAG TPA: chemotaxis protein CheA, partial [Fibrobacteraceae bacterium]|nr:chemotaxis protein CheA [Fibrobacteraceae bacterium]
LRRKVARAELIMRQIQELSMSLRMVSIKGVFQKMARLVRDLSKKLEKRVDFVMEGENTELDKSVVENIGDPLVHMVRNALDHGIETAQERRDSGKPDVAKVTLRAYHNAGNVYIEIEDDGRGIDRNKVLNKAITQKLVPPNANLSDADVYQLLFLPGFSTAAKVTDVSGRGVGMDVVKKNIESLRGSVEINSELGQGSCFTIRLPLTLAIIDGMVVRVAQERFILPTLQVVEMLKPKAEQIEHVLGKGEIIRIRNEIVRVVRLDKILRIPGKRHSIEEGVILVVEDASGQRCGIATDEIMDQQQVVIKNIGGGMSEVPGISGGAIMNNGEVSLILDVSGIVRLAKEAA